METSTGLIIGYTLLSKEDGKGSATLEPMAAKSCLEELLKEGFRIDMFVSDRSTSVKTVVVGINQKYGIEISHEFDCWHLIKNLMAKIRDIKVLNRWLETIKNFLWFAFSKAEGNKMLKRTQLC